MTITHCIYETNNEQPLSRNTLHDCLKSKLWLLIQNKYKGTTSTKRVKQNPVKRGNDEKEWWGGTGHPICRAMDQTFALNVLCLFFCEQVISVWPAAQHCVCITSGSRLKLLLQQSEPPAKTRFRQISLSLSAPRPCLVWLQTTTQDYTVISTRARFAPWQRRCDAAKTWT